MIKIIIKITNRIYLIINSIPKKLIFNIFTINLEKFFCSIIFGNYSTMLLNINGQKILSKNYQPVTWHMKVMIHYAI